MSAPPETNPPTGVVRQCGRCRAWHPTTEHGQAEWWLCAACRRVLMPGTR